MLQAVLVPQVQLEQLDPLELLVQPALLGAQAQLVLREKLEQLEPRAHKV